MHYVLVDRARVKGWGLALCITLGALMSGCASAHSVSPKKEPTTKRGKITLRKAIEPRRNAPPTRIDPKAQTTPSGLRHMRLKAGTGDTHPSPSSHITVHYMGWTEEGRVLDSSYQSGGPARFKLTQVIKGWQEGVQLMVVGEKRRFWIPGHLAYADSPMTHVPKGMLTFDIELLSIE